MNNKKEVIKKYLGKTPFFLDLRKKSLLKDNIDIEVWEKNMQFLENPNDWDLQEKIHPLIKTITSYEEALPQMLWKSQDRNWFIAAYPDVIMYFYPEIDLSLTQEEKLKKRKVSDPDFQKLQEYLDKFRLNQTLTLIHIKDFYKNYLKKEFLMSMD